MKMNCMVLKNGARILREWKRMRLTVEQQDRMRARGYMVVTL